MPTDPAVLRRLATLSAIFIGSSFGLASCGEIRGQAIVEPSSTSRPSATGTGTGAPNQPVGSSGGTGGFGGSPNRSPSSQEQGGARHSFSPASAAGSGTAPFRPDIQLCQPCREHRDCPRNDSYCIRDPNAATGICGFGCSHNSCPPGHNCVSLEQAPIPQCVPVAQVCQLGTPSIFSPLAPQAEMRAFNLMLLNRYRMERGLTPLIEDPCLGDEAEVATSDWLRSGRQHEYFVNSCEAIRPNCACGWLEENQGFSFDLQTGWQAALQRVIEDEVRLHPNDHFANNIFSESLERVGIGIIVGEKKLWFTNAFGGSAQPPPP